jgi:hypothetical protein
VGVWAWVCGCVGVWVFCHLNQMNLNICSMLFPMPSIGKPLYRDKSMPSIGKPLYRDLKACQGQKRARDASPAVKPASLKLAKASDSKAPLAANCWVKRVRTCMNCIYKQYEKTLNCLLDWGWWCWIGGGGVFNLWCCVLCLVPIYK